MKSSPQQENHLQERVLAIGPNPAPIPGFRNDLARAWTIFLFLLRRDIRLTYADTALGLFWVLAPPLAATAVLTLVFGLVLRIDSGPAPYPVLVLSGLCPWLFLNSSLSKGCESLRANADIIRKTYFPRLAVPASAALSGGLDFLVTIAALLAAGLIFGLSPAWSWLLLPIPALVALCLGLGGAIWLAALNMRLADVGKILPIVLQIGFYISPVVYPAAPALDKIGPIYALNPAVGIIETFRWSLYRPSAFPTIPLAVSTAWAALLLISGIIHFRRVEDTAADFL